MDFEYVGRPWSSSVIENNLSNIITAEKTVILRGFATSNEGDSFNLLLHHGD